MSENEKILTIGQLRVMAERYSEDTEVWVMQNGRLSPAFGLGTFGGDSQGNDGLLVRGAEVPREEPSENHRCAICAWPLVTSRKFGCVRGDCSLRPRPNSFYDPERAIREGSARAHCPTCDSLLEKVCQSANSPLNADQFDSVKAGDYFCLTCPDNDRGQNGRCYWWTREVKAK